MSEGTGIGWTDATDNIIVAAQGGWWCKHVTAGCDNCYAEKINQSAYFHGNKLKYAGEPPVMKLREDIIDGWARKKKPKRRFVASMTDVFGEWVPRSWIFRYLDGMRAAPLQTFQLLTKRPAIMRREVLAWLKERGLERVPENIWLGVSITSQDDANVFIPILLDIPSVHFVSAEPLLRRTSLDRGGWLRPKYSSCQQHDSPMIAQLARGAARRMGAEFIDWVIIGGESGTRKQVIRPMHPEWAMLIIDQCVAAGAPVFFKQWGAWRPVAPIYAGDGVPEYEDAIANANESRCEVFDFDGKHWPEMQPPAGSWMFERVGAKAAGRIIHGRTWDEFPFTDAEAA